MRLALPGHDLALYLPGALLLRVRAELGRGADGDAVGVAVLSLSLAPTRDLVLSRLASGWSFAQAGGEALDILVAAGHPPGALLGLAGVAVSAVLSPALAAPGGAQAPSPRPAPAEPDASELLPDGFAVDGIPWQRASLDGVHPAATEEQRERRALVGEAIRAHRDGRLVEWAEGQARVTLSR